MRKHVFTVGVLLFVFLNTVSCFSCWYGYPEESQVQIVNNCTICFKIPYYATSGKVLYYYAEEMIPTNLTALQCSNTSMEWIQLGGYCCFTALCNNPFTDVQQTVVPAGVVNSLGLYVSGDGALPLAIQGGASTNTFPNPFPVTPGYTMSSYGGVDTTVSGDNPTLLTTNQDCGCSGKKRCASTNSFCTTQVGITAAFIAVCLVAEPCGAFAEVGYLGATALNYGATWLVDQINQVAPVSDGSGIATQDSVQTDTTQRRVVVSGNLSFPILLTNNSLYIGVYAGSTPLRVSQYQFNTNISINVTNTSNQQLVTLEAGTWFVKSINFSLTYQFYVDYNISTTTAATTAATTTATTAATTTTTTTPATTAATTTTTTTAATTAMTTTAATTPTATAKSSSSGAFSLQLLFLIVVILSQI